MEFKERELLLSYFCCKNFGFHYRNALVEKYFYSKHWFSLFYKHGATTLVTQLISDPKLAAPYVQQVVDHKHSDSLSFKFRANSSGQLDLATTIALSSKTNLGINQSFSVQEFASGKLNSGFGFSLQFNA